MTVVVRNDFNCKSSIGKTSVMILIQVSILKKLKQAGKKLKLRAILSFLGRCSEQFVQKSTQTLADLHVFLNIRAQLTQIGALWAVGRFSLVVQLGSWGSTKIRLTKISTSSGVKPAANTQLVSAHRRWVDPLVDILQNLQKPTFRRLRTATLSSIINASVISHERLDILEQIGRAQRFRNMRQKLDHVVKVHFKQLAFEGAKKAWKWNGRVFWNFFILKNAITGFHCSPQ